jgi:hypothetical protein
MMSSLHVTLTFFVAASYPLLADTWTPDPSLGNVELHRRLYDIGRAYGDQHFDPAANMLHQKPKDHIVRESAYYAFALLLTGDPRDRARAQEVIKKVLLAEDTRPDSQWRGAFLWRAEDDWATAKNPDLNSAAFVGTALAEITNLDRQHPCLDPDVRGAVDTAGKLAVGAVMRRNVDPGYTNISLLSTALAAAGAKFWSVPGADKFADDKLSAVLQLADDGAVYEYSSPTYSAVDISGATMARQFAFSDDLYLALDGKYPLSDQLEDVHGWDQGGLAVLAALPIKPRPEFKLPIPAERTWTAIGPNDGVHPPRHLYQYRDGNFVLGTVAFQDEWKQKRNLVADWRTDLPAPQSFRIGFCIDESNETLPGGFPYASILFHSQQKGAAALVALEATRTLPTGGACSLLFDTGATVADPKANPVVVQDGATTTYLYPVSNGAVEFETKTDNHGDQHTFQVNRPWTAADALGAVHVISYLVVFRPAASPAPKVSDIVLASAADQISATAKVDGTVLTLSFKP